MLDLDFNFGQELFKTFSKEQKGALVTLAEIKATKNNSGNAVSFLLEMALVGKVFLLRKKLQSIDHDHFL